MNPRQLVPQSNMPGYPWLATKKLDAADIEARMRTLRRLGDPYSDADIASAPAAVAGKTEMDALIAYLLGLGIRNEPTPGTSPPDKISNGGAP
jgi:cytochrome c oxidase cbb3-type subunit 2